MMTVLASFKYCHHGSHVVTHQSAHTLAISQRPQIALLFQSTFNYIQGMQSRTDYIHASQETKHVNYVVTTLLRRGRGQWCQISNFVPSARPPATQHAPFELELCLAPNVACIICLFNELVSLPSTQMSGVKVMKNPMKVKSSPFIIQGFKKETSPDWMSLSTFYVNPSNLWQTRKHTHQISTKPGKVSLMKPCRPKISKA